MQKTRVWSLGQEDPMEKETATHSCILAWEIPWIEEPGGRQSVGLQKSRTWLKQLTTNPRWQHYPSAHLWIAGKKVFFFFFLEKKERERERLLFPLVSRSECFLRDLLWVFEEHLAHPSSHVNMRQHTNPLTLPHQRWGYHLRPRGHLLKVIQWQSGGPQSIYPSNPSFSLARVHVRHRHTSYVPMDGFPLSFPGYWLSGTIIISKCSVPQAKKYFMVPRKGWGLSHWFTC